MGRTGRILVFAIYLRPQGAGRSSYAKHTRMTGFLALLASALVGWLTHVAIGDYVSMFGDFAATTFTGGIAYVAAYYYLKKLRG